MAVWALQVPVDWSAWSANPFKDDNWMFQLHALRMTNTGLARYERTSDPAAFHEVLAMALDWWHYHRERPNPYWISWEAMTTGVRASHLAFLFAAF